ncbi:MAG: YbaB/EbfC family nucleoid-associated protein [Candidatus Margulisbacteria bacterium]|nr:YbaB/EbfC family nucleoid-associated protein [Candidatus Margulisiibacteriota bacterium]
MNMFGNMGKMAEMMKQAKRMKDEMSRARFEGEAGGVKVTVNGEMDLLEVKIPPEMTAQKIEGSVKDAANKALRTAKSEAAKLMSKMTGGMQLPGM